LQHHLLSVAPTIFIVLLIVVFLSINYKYRQVGAMKFTDF